jgi:hypothetical protein
MDACGLVARERGAPALGRWGHPSPRGQPRAGPPVVLLPSLRCRGRHDATHLALLAHFRVGRQLVGERPARSRSVGDVAVIEVAVGRHRVAQAAALWRGSAKKPKLKEIRI